MIATMASQTNNTAAAMSDDEEACTTELSQIRILLDALSLKEYKFNLSLNQIMMYTLRTILVFAVLVYIVPSKLLIMVLILIMALIILLYLTLYRNSSNISRKFNKEKVDKLLHKNESKSSGVIDDSVTG